MPRKRDGRAQLLAKLRGAQNMLSIVRQDRDRAIILLETVLDRLEKRGIKSDGAELQDQEIKKAGGRPGSVRGGAGKIGKGKIR